MSRVRLSIPSPPRILKSDRRIDLGLYHRHRDAFDAAGGTVSQRTAFFHLGEMIELGPTPAMFTNPQKPLTQGFITGRFG